MIDFERWDEIKPLVQDALDLPEGEREAYLDEACQGDEELRRQASALLAVSVTRADAYDDFVVMPPGVHVVDFNKGDEIGPYRIVRPLGTGGMSTVYLADDPRNGRQVALKVLRKPHRRRHEERTVARFNHQNIVTFHDSGQIEGGPAYFVMEYIDGEPITTYCEAKGLSIKERLRLFLSVCDAVAYAHRHLVVHRDLKPANILVNNEGKPKLLDFGIAKSLSPSPAEVTVTTPEDRALTVAFASPEQLTGESTSTSTDIYSLGVLLCLMLTGRLPYSVKSVHELPWAIRVAEPKRPSQLVKEPPSRLADERGRPVSESETRKLERELRGDLDAIVLKTLRKEPDRRYSTVAELAADIGRNLGKEPVSARKGSRWYRAKKFIRRHPVPAVAMIALVVVAFWLSFLYREAAHQRDQAQNQAERAEQIKNLFIDALKIGDPWRSPKGPTTAQEFLDYAKQRVYSELHTRPADQVELLNVLGSIYSGIGLRNQAAAVLTSANKLAEQHFGKDHALTIESTVLLADVLIRMGKDIEAEKLNTEALARSKSVFGRKHRITADIIEHFGNVCSHRGEYACAIEYYKQALTIRRALFSEDHEVVASGLTEIGIIYSKSGNLQEAGEMLRRALAIRRKLYPGSHPATANTLQAIAILLHKAGDYSAAEPLYRESLQMRRAAYGNTHPAVIASLTAFGLLLKDKGAYNEAEHTLREAVRAGRIAHANGNPSHTDSVFNLAALLYEQGKYEEAKSLFTETLKIDTATSGAGHPKVADSLSHLGMIATAQGSYVQAEVLLGRALEIRRKELGEDSTLVAFTLNNFGTLYRNLGEFRRAEAVVRQAVEIWTAKYGTSHPSTLLGKNNLAALLTDLRRFEEAEEILTGILTTAREELGSEHKLVGAILMSRADLYAKQIRLAQAHSDIEQSLGILQALSPINPVIARAWSVQGDILIGLGQNEAAQKTLFRSQAALKLYEGKNSYWNRRTEKSLAGLSKNLMSRGSERKAS